MFTLGASVYGAGCGSSLTTNGAVVIYTDESGNYRSSENGDQTASTFSINDLADIQSDTEEKFMKAVFSCKVYDGTGKSMVINGAEVREL